jgi:protein phosphatase
LFSWLKGRAAKPMRVTLAGATHTGKQRDHNEDAFGIDLERQLAVIADGMGGLERGEVASRVVVESVLAEALRGEAPATGLKVAHRKILGNDIAKVGEKMGATAITLRAQDGEAVINWVGDSRAYLWRSGQLNQLTKDHSFVQELLDINAITAAEAEKHPNRNVITRGVGLGEIDKLQIDELRLPLQAGDRLLLCTDGLSGYLSNERLQEELRRGGNDQELIQRLIQRTLKDTEAGDNLTVACLSVSS